MQKTDNYVLKKATEFVKRRERDYGQIESELVVPGTIVERGEKYSIVSFLFKSSLREGVISTSSDVQISIDHDSGAAELLTRL